MAQPVISIAIDEKSRGIERIQRGYGSIVSTLLSDSSVVEIMLNADGLLWVERLGQDIECVGVMPASQAETLICNVAAYHKTTITREKPIFSGELPNGERFEALLPPVVPSPVFTIRLKASRLFTLTDYLADSILSEAQKSLLESAVKDRKNILVVGGTGSGKTTLTNAIIAEMVRVSPHHRLVIIEDTAEIQCQAQNAVILRTSDTVDMLRLLKETMRLRPDRILVGEVRGPEALALLKAWNTGHPGGVATIHANHAQAGLIRLEQLIAEATTSPMSVLIGEAVDLVVSIAKTPTGRRVQEIIQVQGFENGGYRLL